MTWLGIVVAFVVLQVVFYLLGRRYGGRPFLTDHAGVRIRVHPRDYAIELLEEPTAEQLEEITVWASDWDAVLKTRGFVELA